MKKIAGWTLIAFLLIMIVLCSGCGTPGDTQDYNDVVIQYNHVQYKVKQIQVGKDWQDYIYIMYPINDTTKGLPTVINYPVQHGKTSSNQAVVVLK